MKKTLFLTFVALIFTLAAPAQEFIEPVEKWKVAEVWGNNYHGWAFHQDVDVDFTVENQDGRFTPTDAEVAEAEHLIYLLLRLACGTVVEHPEGVGDAER